LPTYLKKKIPSEPQNSLIIQVLLQRNLCVVTYSYVCSEQSRFSRRKEVHN